MSETRTRWLGIGIGLALVLTIVAGVIAFRPSADSKVVIGKNDEVYYYRRATPDDARALGQALRSTGFFNDRGTSVLLWKGAGAPTVVSFVMASGAWDRPNAISNYTEIGRRVAHSVGGFPLQVHLVDSDRNIRMKLVVGKDSIGAKDAVYYFGRATEADANALGQALRSAGYFSDSGATVAILKGEGTVISFVVQDGLWDQPDAVFTLDRLVRQVAGAVGGLPVRLRLLDREMAVRKEFPVQ